MPLINYREKYAKYYQKLKASISTELTLKKDKDLRKLDEIKPLYKRFASYFFENPNRRDVKINNIHLVRTYHQNLLKKIDDANKLHNGDIIPDNPDDMMSHFLSIAARDVNLNCDIKKLPWKRKDVPKFDYPKFTPQREVSKPFNEVRYAVIDIETEGLYPHKHLVKAIGLKGNFCTEDVNDSESIIITNDSDEPESDRDIIVEFFKFLNKYKPEHIIFHNGFNFDLYFIYTRCLVLKITQYTIVLESGGFKVGNMPKQGAKTAEFVKFTYDHGEIYDTMILVGMWDFIFSRLTNGMSLKSAPYEMGLVKEPRIELEYEELLECYKNGYDHEYDLNMYLLEDYLEDDLEATEMLYQFLGGEKYYQIGLIPNMFPQDIIYASPAKKAECVYEYLYASEITSGGMDMPVNDAKVEYTGGKTFVKDGVYSNCAKLDVSSQYPHIQLYFGIASSKDPYLKFLGFLEYAVNRRLNEFKKDLARLEKEGKKNTNEYKEIKAVDSAYKVIINGCGYGFLGTMGYNFNCMNGATLITAYGRKILLLMEKKIKQFGCFEIVNMDTDGIIISVMEEEAAALGFTSTQAALKQLQDEIHRYLPPMIRLDLEFQDYHIYASGRKNYLMFDEKVSDKFVAKGKFKKRNVASFKKQFIINYVRTIFTDSIKAANKYYIEYRNKMKDGQFLLKDVIVAENVRVNDVHFVHKTKQARPGEKIKHYTSFIENIGKSGKDLGDKHHKIRVDNRNDYEELLELTLDELSDKFPDKPPFLRGYVDILQEDYEDVTREIKRQILWKKAPDVARKLEEEERREAEEKEKKKLERKLKKQEKYDGSS